MTSQARIAIVADIHHGADAYTKKGTQALPLLEEFRRFVAKTRPDLVIDLGDRISDESPENDARLEREVMQALRPIPEIAPIAHLCGNHDRDYLSVAENETIFGCRLGHEVRDLGPWQVALWRADTLIRRPGGFDLPDQDLDWLAQTIAAADRPLLIVSHVPVSGHSQAGNYYFERNPQSSTYPQADRVRAVLRGARVPVACIAGHVHWNTVTTVDGIVHLTQQSLTESFTTGGEPAAAFGLLELGADMLHWQVHGLDAMRASFPVASLARRWTPPLPPFHELPERRGREVRIASHAMRVPAE